MTAVDPAAVDSPNPALPPAITTTTCEHCQATVPAAVFCGACGAHLHADAGSHRLFAFAAAPSEHLLRLSIFSTLLPHLPHRNSHRFRDGLAAGCLAVALLLAVNWSIPALLAAVVLLPVLYLLYLYEIEVFEHQPVRVLAATLGVGAVLGVIFQLTAGRLLSDAILSNTPTVALDSAGAALLAQLGMLIGPLLLLRHRHFNQALDGVAFGVTSALGFTAAATITAQWSLLTAAVDVQLNTADALINLMRTALLVPIVDAGVTGVVLVLIWAAHHTRSAARHQSQRRDVALLVGAIAVQGVLGALAVSVVTSTLGLLVLWAGAVVLVVLALRVAIHFALLGEIDLEMSATPTACAECHAVFPLMHFCPNCGISRSASPKRHRELNA